MTVVSTGRQLPTLDTPQPQPLPGHGDSPDATSQTEPASPTPHHVQFALGAVAALAAVPAAMVATEKFGANRWVATGIAGAALGLGMLGTFNYKNGPQAPPSPGSVSFDEIARPAANAAFATTAVIAGGSVVVGGMAAFVATGMDTIPKWSGNLAMVGAAAAATFGASVGLQALGHWVHNASADARTH